MENVLEFVKELKIKDVNVLVGTLKRTKDLDKRMDIVSNILSELWFLDTEDIENYPEGVEVPENFDFQDFQDKLKDLVLE